MSRYKLTAIPLTVLAVLLTASALCFGNPSTEFSSIHIKNFGKMDDRFYRGAQPKESDYKDLAALGIKTVIDLTDSPKAYEKPAVEALGMHYVNIPLADKKYPEAAQIDAFMKLVTDPNTGKFFVHCAGGRHRTGIVGAVYRFNLYGWDFDKAYAEMKTYDFYTSWGHGAQKQFVEDYWKQFQARAHTPVATATTGN